MKENYPPPARKTPSRLALVASQGAPPEFNTVEEWEEHIFRRADHFNIVRFGSHNGSDCRTVKTFAEAVYIAHANRRALIYAVTLSGASFCLPRKQYDKYAQIYLETREEGK